MPADWWEKTWDVKQTEKVHESKVDRLSAQVKTFDETSVRTLVADLNDGIRKCSAGLCLMYSESKRTWFLLYRSDKEEAAESLKNGGTANVLEKQARRQDLSLWKHSSSSDKRSTWEHYEGKSASDRKSTWAEYEGKSSRAADKDSIWSQYEGRSSGASDKYSTWSQYDGNRSSADKYAIWDQYEDNSSSRDRNSQWTSYESRRSQTEERSPQKVITASNIANILKDLKARRKAERKAEAYEEYDSKWAKRAEAYEEYDSKWAKRADAYEEYDSKWAKRKPELEKTSKKTASEKWLDQAFDETFERLALENVAYTIGETPTSHESKAGDWECPTCESLVFARRSKCRECGTKKPGENTHKGVSSSGATAKTSETTQKGASRPGDWNCPKCGEHVFASKAACRKCSTPKPAEQVERPGDWICPHCKELVFAGKDACFRCGKPKPKETKDSEFARPADWKCPNCWELNLISKNECFRCGTSKPKPKASGRSKSAGPLRNKKEEDSEGGRRRVVISPGSSPGHRPQRDPAIDVPLPGEHSDSENKPEDPAGGGMIGLASTLGTLALDPALIKKDNSSKKADRWELAEQERRENAVRWEKEQRQKRKAATAIQKIARGWLVRFLAKRAIAEEAAALHVQRIARGWLVRLERRREAQEAGVLTIQKVARGWLTRCQQRKRQAEEAAALALQKVMRGWMLRLQLKRHAERVAAEAEREAARIAAVTIQKNVRGWRVRTGRVPIGDTHCVVPDEAEVESVADENAVQEGDASVDVAPLESDPSNLEGDEPHPDCKSDEAAAVDMQSQDCASNEDDAHESDPAVEALLREGSTPEKVEGPRRHPPDESVQQKEGNPVEEQTDDRPLSRQPSVASTSQTTPEQDSMSDEVEVLKCDPSSDTLLPGADATPANFFDCVDSREDDPWGPS